MATPPAAIMALRTDMVEAAVEARTVIRMVDREIKCPILGQI